MAHAQPSHDNTHSSTAASPTPQSLRERIGQENMTQSSVLASRRLDEALLRLDRAAGRDRSGATNRSASQQRNTASEPTQLSHIQDRSPALGLELDDSVSQSSAMWLELEETGEQWRFDSEHAPAQKTKSHFPPNSKQPSSAAPPPPRGTAPRSDAAEAEITARSVKESSTRYAENDLLTADALEALFAQPIDVMILSTTTKIHSTKALEPIAAPEPAAPIADSVKSNVEEPHQRDVVTPTVATDAVDITEDASDCDAEPTAEMLTPPLQEFAAAWQVDEFLVPEAINELFLVGSIAEQLAARLATAREQGLRTIAITSCKSGEGRSTVAIGMALSVAFSGLRVALVDADREGVKIATDLHLDVDHSWLDAIRQGESLEEVAVASAADALTLLPLLDRAEEAPFEHHELAAVVAELRKSFDMVIVDCGASSVSDAAICDTALIVRDMQRTKAAEVETLAMSLRRTGRSGVGVIENFC
jgi:Mrp family chromosome partitioning ATPase